MIRNQPRMSHEDRLDLRHRPQGAWTPFIVVLVGLLAPLFQSSCGAGGLGSSSTPLPSIVSVRISPIAVSVPPGMSQQFSVTVSGTDNTAVQWSLMEGAAGGSISDTGMYTAPATNGTYHVAATSQADIEVKAWATIQVAPVSVKVTPDTLTTGTNRSVTLSVTVTGTSDTSVTWSVQEGAAGGTVSSGGIYTAPATLGTYHVLATSVVDTSKSGTATVTVVSGGFFVPVGSMDQGRGFHTATLLSDGSVLVTGGAVNKIAPYDECAHPDGTTTAEKYDPAKGLFSTSLGSMDSPRFLHNATLLEDGTVLVAGGFGIGGNCAPPAANRSAEVYNPSTGLFAEVAGMLQPRAGHTATKLPNGKVLITGGSIDASNALTAFPYLGIAVSTTELYDPTSKAFTQTGSMSHARFGHTATLLTNGKVLIAGGISEGPFPDYPSTGLTFEPSAEIYDPQTGTFSPAGIMGGPRAGHTATLLADGKVLIAGGVAADGLPSATAEIYDPVSGTFTPTGSMSVGRQLHTATFLATGKVLIVGGSKETRTAELYDPATGSFAATGETFVYHTAHTATLLNSGEVLITGGNDIYNVGPIPDAELYEP